MWLMLDLLEAGFGLAGRQCLILRVASYGFFTSNRKRFLIGTK